MYTKIENENNLISIKQFEEEEFFNMHGIDGLIKYEEM
jgi:hypothetical protein